MKAADQRVPLTDLYQGDHWTKAQALVPLASKAGFIPELWVASAGLGLRPVTDTAPAYAATFSPRHADSVAGSPDDSARWWRCLQADDSTRSLATLSQRGDVLLVLSEAYANVMVSDLDGLAQGKNNTVLIGGAQGHPGITRVPSDATLRHALGGTLTSLNVRMAAAWLEHCSNARLTSPEIQTAWNTWTAQVSKRETYNRRPLTDEAVIEFIRTNHAQHPDHSRTRMLRELRGQGLACEQKRFAHLYAVTVEKQ
ncbi:hypothetical protein [Kitasatospora sp. NPDC008115]|uniref:hypothetical protein n=1 Tax=Kitasatospora sp. NPDC008115 TaxID=3364022 RepID=UPI0036E7CF21